jgi:hypothetical protein
MFIKVRAEEVLIGGALGTGLGLAVAAPLAAGMPSLIPTLSAGPWGVLQSGIALALAGAGAVAGGWMAGRQERDSHIRGNRYFADYWTAARQLQAVEAAQFSPAQAAGKVHGIRIGGVELARRAATRGAFVHGLPGSGKTVILTSLIDQALERGDRLVLHDPKGDFVRRYYDPARLVLLGPWDARAAVWDAARDLPHPADADQFAVAVCGATDDKGVNKSFHEAAASVLAGVIRSHMVDGTAWRWSDLRDSMSQGAAALWAQAQRGDTSIALSRPEGGEGHDTTNGERIALSILTNAAKWLLSYAAVDAADADRTRFSIRGWLAGTAHKDVQIVVLNSDDRYESAAQALFASMLGVVASMASSPALPEVSADSSPALWFVLDEFPQLGQAALRMIQKIAEMGRSRGMRMVIGLQDESQLPAKLGAAMAAPLLAMQAMRLYVESSPQAADAISKRVGERDVSRINSTAEGGATSGKTKSIERQEVILPSDLAGLRLRTDATPRGAEVIMHAGAVLGRLVQPFPERRPDVAPPQVESATWQRGTLPDGATPPVAETAACAGTVEAVEPESTNGASVDGPDLF